MARSWIKPSAYKKEESYQWRLLSVLRVEKLKNTRKNIEVLQYKVDWNLVRDFNKFENAK